VSVAQVVISGVGYGLDKLDEGQGLLDRWSDSKARRLTLRTEQKQATLSETEAADLAEVEIGLLRDTLAVVLEGNTALLTTLGIKPRRQNGTKANGADNGQTEADAPTASSEAEPIEQVAADQAAQPETQAEAPAGDQNGDETQTGPKKRRRKGLAEARLEQQRLFMAQVHSLPEADLSRLAEAGWPRSRLLATSEMIEAVATADDRQQQRMSARAAESKRCQQYEAEVRLWYRQAVRLCLIAIKKLPPEQRAELLRLLGLV
jgi:hypothetical protein